MKHCIIAKYVPGIDEGRKIELVSEIKELFDHTLEIEGIHEVNVYPNCIARDNRYDLMIEIGMDKDALAEYDGCLYHRIWKDKYGELIEKKTIFDYE